MSKKIGFIMDPMDSLKVSKDSTVAMILAAQNRGFEVHVMLQSSLYCQNAADGIEALALSQLIHLRNDLSGATEPWYQQVSEQEIRLNELDAILMRKDPPFDMEYINTTYMLDIAESQGTLVVNRPTTLRDANEKMFITRFPQCCTPMCISRDEDRIKQFIQQHQDVIIKPLDGMGGAGIYRLSPTDANLSVILETATKGGSKTLMAQCFIPEIRAGDKRILLIDGKPVPYALARIPAEGETRGNLAAGGSGVGVELTDRDRWICEQIAPTLIEKGVVFAGIDVIGDYLTEINITSPTCIRELDKQYDLDIASDLMHAIETRLSQ